MSTLFLKKFPKVTFLSAALCSLFLIPNLDAVREGQKQLPQRHDDLMQHMRAQRKKLTQSSKKTDKPPTGLRSYHLSDPTLKEPHRQKRMSHTSEPTLGTLQTHDFKLEKPKKPPAHTERRSAKSLQRLSERKARAARMAKAEQELAQSLEKADKLVARAERNRKARDAD